MVGRNVHVHAGAVLEECIVLDNCEIGAGTHVRRTILDKNVRLPAAERIGFDADRDRQRYHVTEKGIVVVPGRRSPVEVSYIGILTLLELSVGLGIRSLPLKRAFRAPPAQVRRRPQRSRGSAQANVRCTSGLAF